MRGGFKLGRLFGIELSLDPSWLFIFFLVSWNLTSVFGQWHPEWGVGNVAVAVVAAILFFASVVAHELAHALVALRFGMKVRGIRLFLFGGVSDIEREPPSPKAEFWMAIVGPLMSFAIGIGGLVLAGLLAQAKTTPDDPIEAARAFGPVATCLAWLGPVNITLGLFNLIPGFPLDGGRVLRAALWAATGSLHKATSWASATGRAVGWLFIAIGIMMAFGTRVPFFGQGAGSGLWLVFIGWFLSSAASRSYEGMLVDQALGDVRVEQLMRRSARALDPRVTVDEAVHGWFVRADARAFPVVDDDRLVGLMRVEDAVGVPREAWKTEVVGAVMSPLSDAVTTTPQEDVATALRKLGHAELEQLPVVEGGALVGVIERSAIARWLELHPGSGGGHPTPRAT